MVLAPILHFAIGSECYVTVLTDCRLPIATLVASSCSPPCRARVSPQSPAPLRKITINLTRVRWGLTVDGSQSKRYTRETWVLFLLRLANLNLGSFDQ